MSKVLVYDTSGLYVHIALALARKFEDVAYFSEWRAGFPTSKPDLIGQGFPNIRRISHFFEELSGSDLIVFPHVGDPDLQQHLRDEDYRVFGTGALELLEMDKVAFQEWLDEVKLPKPKTVVTTGLDEVEKILRESTELYLKGNYRGDFETFHHIKWELSEQWLQELRHDLGPFEKDVQIVVQESVDGVEIGYDGFICDGRFPNIGQWGFECKDAGYLGKVDLYENLPEQLRVVNSAISEFVGQYEIPVRGAFSTEVRVGKDGVPYFIDPTTRFPLPPSGGMTEWYENWPELVDSIARGAVMSPHPKKKYMAEICLLPEDRKVFKAVRWPESMNRRVKLTYWYRNEGVNYSIPISDAFVGTVIGFGNTMEAALQQAEETARSIEAYGVTWSESVCDQLRDVVKECGKIGIKF